MISVASHDGQGPLPLLLQPGSRRWSSGLRASTCRVAWAEGGWITATGNSFAAPHITGIVAKILGKHPGLTVFQMKTVLRALSANMPRANS